MFLPSILQTIYRPVLRRAARQILQGRPLNREHLSRGRWLKPDVDRFLADVWAQVDELAPRAHLAAIPTLGNRHNVFLAIITTAAYQTLLERGVSRVYARELVADVGWKVYAWMLQSVAVPVRLTTRDPQKRIDRVLRLLMVFPFSTPGEPGYSGQGWREEGRFYTHWTSCPPQAFIRRLLESMPDRGEMKAFIHAWCNYDWAAADLLVNDGTHGHYSRPCTLSMGDPICNMCWSAEQTERSS